MGQKIEVPADESFAAQIWQTYGLAMAFEAMGGDQPKSTLPGFALAMALVEKELASMRAITAGAAYRAAAKAGHDVAKVASVCSSIKNSKPYLEIEMADLMDLAEAR